MAGNTVAQIQAHAKAAQAIWREFITTEKTSILFQTCFHLRPTSAGVTIVSTLPFAPMRGIAVKMTDLREKLDSINKVFKKIVQDDEKEALSVIEEIGFNERNPNSDPTKIREEMIQAIFIKGMIKNEPQFRGIQFLASELNLKQGNRFDIVGIKDATLYIFELKAKRETEQIITQLNRYIQHFEDNQADFIKLLEKYPIPLTQPIERLQGIAVMPWAASTTLQSGHQEESNVEIWLYEKSIAFN